MSARKKIFLFDLAVCGGPKAGKSTLVNALIGEDLLPEQGGLPLTCFPTIVEHAEEAKGSCTLQLPTSFVQLMLATLRGLRVLLQLLGVGEREYRFPAPEASAVGEYWKEVWSLFSPAIIPWQQGKVECLPNAKAQAVYPCEDLFLHLQSHCVGEHPQAVLSKFGAQLKAWISKLPNANSPFNCLLPIVRSEIDSDLLSSQTVSAQKGMEILHRMQVASRLAEYLCMREPGFWCNQKDWPIVRVSFKNLSVPVGFRIVDLPGWRLHQFSEEGECGVISRVLYQTKTLLCAFGATTCAHNSELPDVLSTFKKIRGQSNCIVVALTSSDKLMGSEASEISELREFLKVSPEDVHATSVFTTSLVKWFDQLPEVQEGRKPALDFQRSQVNSTDPKLLAWLSLMAPTRPEIIYRNLSLEDIREIHADLKRENGLVVLSDRLSFMHHCD